MIVGAVAVARTYPAEEPRPMEPLRPTLADEPIREVHPDGPRLSSHEVADLAARLPEWTLVERREVLRLERVFLTPSWPAGLDLAQRVGALAEAANHHPAILIEWGRVTVTWWTLRVRGLHRNDFVMAARTDRLWESWSWDGDGAPIRNRYDGPGY
jgi:4a-hydroxytetrahydrobiopterin dehydratase